jgi:hypothetical protein
MHTYLRFGLLLSVLLLPLGCGTKGKSYDVAPVSGHVTMDGKPMADLEVRFSPSAGLDYPYSVGVTDEQGNYTLKLAGPGGGREGAVVGEHHVTIDIDDQLKGKLFQGKRPYEVVPAKYNKKSQMKATVPPEGKKDADYNLTSK